MAYLRGLAPEYARRFNHFQSPLLRLPPEILPLILGAAASDTRERLRGWISLGHVCYDLRAALLSMHALWADVVFDARYERAQEELLRRAGCSPIAIQLDPNTPSWSHDRALELLPRACTINAHHLPRERMKAIVGTLIEGSCSALEELSLIFHMREHPVVPGLILLSQDASELATPKLRDVHFQNVFIPVDMSSVRALTLEWNNADHPQPVHDNRTFTAMLRRCCRLETLRLRDWLPMDYSASHIVPNQDECKISLPHLRHFELLEDPQDMHAFLTFWAILDIPQTTTIHLDFSKGDLPLDRVLLLIQSLHVLIPHTQVAGISHISQLGVSGNYEGCVEVTLGSIKRQYQSNPFTGSPMTAHTPSRRREAFHSPPLKIKIRSAWETPADLLAYLECIFATLRLRVSDIDIVEFDIHEEFFLAHGPHHTNEHLLYTMFPSISRLDLDSQADIARILDSESGTTQGLDYLPNLRALHLIKWTSSDATFSLADVEHLIDTIEKRVARGKSLHALSLEGFFSKSDFGPPGVKERCLQQLTALVPHVRFEELDPDVDSEK
ncbi:hypothetical protein PENSPDRAFT_759989 [Peniophora sp. CONT]|nr:hypothetical protein PENSPDRAFT_759989 [Peniophora sp. CONT]